jgi:hypothetical protein
MAYFHLYHCANTTTHYYIYMIYVCTYMHTTCMYIFTLYICMMTTIGRPPLGNFRMKFGTLCMSSSRKSTKIHRKLPKSGRCLLEKCTLCTYMYIVHTYISYIPVLYSYCIITVLCRPMYYIQARIHKKISGGA